MASEKEINEIAKEAWSQMYVEEYKAINGAELQAIKAALIINGGAAVALLGFLASVINIKNGTYVSEFALGLIVYVSGVLASAVAYWTVYWSQSNHAHYMYNSNLKHRKTLSGIFNDLSVFLIVLAYSCFGYGGWVMYKTFLEISNG